MKIPRPTDEDKAWFRTLMEPHEGVEIKAMFGNVGGFVVANRQMCAGLFGPSVGVRVPEERRVVLLDHDGAGPFGPEGRPMKEYVSLPDAWREDADQASSWVAEAVAYTATLPPKKK